jgi:hypothetical protein
MDLRRIFAGVVMNERIEAARTALESGRVRLMLPGSVRDALLGLLDELEHLGGLVRDLREAGPSPKAAAVSIASAAAAVRMHEQRHHPVGELGGVLDAQGVEERVER